VTRITRIPRPLTALLLVALVEALAWTIALPPTQGPDEISHLAYTQRIVEAGEIPYQRSDPAVPGQPYSSELSTALTIGDIAPLYANPAARAPGSAVDERIWGEADAELAPGSRANGGFTSAMKNPPLYYLYAAPWYAAAHFATIWDRALVMRLANIPAFLAIVIFTWLLAGELLGRSRPWLQTLAAGAAALQPQLVHMTAVANPDVFLSALWTAALYVGVLLVKRGPSRGLVAWMLGLAAAGILTHGRGLALAVVAVVALALSLWRFRRPASRRARTLAIVATGAAVGAGALGLFWYAMRGDPSASRVREAASYLWQFYLPKLGFMAEGLRSDWGVRDVYIDRFFGPFGQLEVTFSVALLDALSVLARVFAVLALVGAMMMHKRLRARWDAVLVLGGAFVASMTLLHVEAYRSLSAGSPDPILTGRYLLPLIGLYGVGIALAIAWLPRRAGVAAGAVVLMGLALLQMSGMGILVERFYA